MGTILLVRHGQAMTGAADYDLLSPLGEQQAGLVGSELDRRGTRPTRILSGTLRRQRQTAEGASLACGWGPAVESEPDWNEFDHSDVLEVAGHPGSPLDAALRERAVSPLDTAIPRWSSGLHDYAYAEPFTDFTTRVQRGLRRLAADLGAGETAVVFTSAGVIAWIAAALTSGGEPQWRALNRVVVNSSISKVVVGRRGTTLISYNEHAHLAPTAVTYS
ncbi:histidine phosphatase family protein [Nocardioides sp. cx-169]|uniref:histidine phosphatase family protein n=1 Tax=Nocardioides sp. cx-169 TaxID=2899080 RepID=UPI001E51D6F9|nr:histidine phosphatase family protein [Nocardioides sp. cx-169]MCD4532999.1 histidine phosphatase family protein [Nocardioides sp. cx-169]